MSASLTATWVEQNQCPLHQSILLTQGPIHEIFMKKYWELTKPWKWLLFSFLVFGFSVWKKPRRFIWGSIYSCTMDGHFRIFKKAVSELICTRLYIFQSVLYILSPVWPFMKHFFTTWYGTGQGSKGVKIRDAWHFLIYNLNH